MLNVVKLFQRACSVRITALNMPFYAVRSGFKPGVYSTWPECQAQTKGFSGPRFKKFETEAEAQAFVDGHDGKAAKGKKEAEKRKSGGADGATEAKQSKGENSSEEGKLVAYTDGCCFNNGKDNPSAGIGVYWGPDDPRNISEFLDGRSTNNRAEIEASRRAVLLAKEEGAAELVIKTDSEFLINCVTKWMSGWKKKGWKTAKGEEVKNKEELMELDEALQGITVDWVHVKGHSGEPGNEAADQLANEGARKKWKQAKNEKKKAK